MTPPALIGLAHGSRDPRAAVAIDQLMAEAARRRPGLTVTSAFLDLTDPDLPTSLQNLRIGRAVAVPLLFSRAFHARIDSPQAVQAARESTGIDIRLADVLGMGDEVLDVLSERAADLGAQELLMVSVGSSDESANQAVRDLAELWSIRRGARVEAAFATCEPRAATAMQTARSAGRKIAIAPLFLAPGLLLDQVSRLAETLGFEVADHLGTAMADLVLSRYDAVTAGWD